MRRSLSTGESCHVHAGSRPSFLLHLHSNKLSDPFTHVQKDFLVWKKRCLFNCLKPGKTRMSCPDLQTSSFQRWNNPLLCHTLVLLILAINLESWLPCIFIYHKIFLLSINVSPLFIQNREEEGNERSWLKSIFWVIIWYCILITWWAEFGCLFR